MKRHQLLLFVFFFLSKNIFSQSIHLRSGTVIVPANLSKEVVDSFNQSARRTAGQAFAVLQFEHIPSAVEQKLLAISGITLLDYIAPNTYTVSISGKAPHNALQAVRTRSIFQLTPRQKLHDMFAKGRIPSWAVKKEGTVDVWVSFPKTLGASDVIARLKEANVEVLSVTYQQYRVLSLRIAASRLQEIAALPFIEYIQPAPPSDQPLNHDSRAGSKAGVLNAPVASGGKGLNGEGVVIGIGDNGDIQGHPDFTGRIINRNANGFNGHGIHVAGTAAGAGIIDERYRGYAPGSTIVSQLFSGVLENAEAYVNDYGMVITNNSYGNIVECDYNGTYDLYSRVIDQQAFDLPNLLHVFAAGNSGDVTCAPYSLGFHTVLGSYQTAKNVVTVGATTDMGALAGFSSRGPVKDGRLKPEIMAMGANVWSTWPSVTYLRINGTSMAAPAVSGGLALLYQRYRQLHNGADPKNGLMKAILCNGAMDLGVTGPDFTHGFGWMNLLRSMQTVENTTYFTGNSTNSGTSTHTITVPANTAQLKVLLYWNDLPASVISVKNLVNDLDLEVTTPSSATVLPKILDTANTALNNAATTGADHVNNIEQVVIDKPTPGTYTFTIKGTTVTNPQQEYFVVYDAVPAGIQVTAPAGGEALVPGEVTKISWDTYGLPGTATIEFSPDGGATWSSIASNVTLSDVVYNWTVPAVSTTNALVRITRNGGSESAVSQPFTIIGQPVLSPTAVQCEGYFAIQWGAIAGATDYEVMMLRGNDMKPMAITSATAYTFSGLSKDSVYWVTVRARVMGKEGRRAYALSRQPNDGNCAGGISDNDLKLDAILMPVTGRLFTSSQLTATQQVSIRIKNLDDAPINTYTVSYSVNGVPYTETIAAPIAGGATITHTFSTTADLSAPGVYIITAKVSSAADPVAANNSQTTIVKQLNNQPINLSADYLENMESATPAAYGKDTLGLEGIDRYDFTRTTPYGRVRTFLDNGIAYSGSKALTLDVDRYYSTGNASYLYGTFNLSNYTAAANDLRLDFQFLQHNQAPNAANRVWIRGSEADPWIEVFNLEIPGHFPGTYRRSASIELSNFLKAAGQTYSSSFGIRWGQAGQYQATSKGTAAGYTFDDIHLYQVVNDVQLVSIDEPKLNSCGLTTATTIKVTVRNAAGNSLTNVPVNYKLNNGSVVTEFIPSLAAGASIQYSFTTPADFSQLTNTLEVYTSYNSDSYKENDRASTTVFNTPVVSYFPYLQDFETGNGGYYTGGRSSSWQYGAPSSRLVDKAASGAKAWKTGLAGTYNDNELSYLYSPCFDVTGMTAPTLSFSVALDIEDCGITACDAAWVEYSADGIAWSRLGASGKGTNWYNKAGNNVWSVQGYSYWHVATQALPTGLSRMRLRFVMYSDPGVTRDGMAIDDIHIYDNTKGIYDGVTTSTPATQAVSGNTWIDFTSGGKLVASIQPSNATLGATDVQAFINTGTARNINNQYYHNRNITIKPNAAILTDPVKVRFYFLDSEAETLLKASGCATCTKPESAYALGVSKYTDADKTVENGTIADNANGVWTFIPPSVARKVPFDKGYYAEFETTGFSEFWLNNGGLDNLTVLPVKLMDFTATKQADDVLVKWKVGSEAEIIRYEVEVARGNAAIGTSVFMKLGEVAGLGNATVTREYSFLDQEPGKFGPRYYRLKMINADGSFSYSAVKPVIFDEAVLSQVYPNPSTGKFHFIYQAGIGQSMTAAVYDAKGSLVKEYRIASNGFLQKLNIDLSANNYASGVYLLQVTVAGKQNSFKLYKR